MAEIKEEPPSVGAPALDPYMVGVVRETQQALNAGIPGNSM